MNTEHGKGKLFMSQRWKWFFPCAMVFFSAGVFLIVYGAVASTEIWMLAPLFSIVFLVLSALAKTWGWFVLFGLLILFFPGVILFQGF